MICGNQQALDQGSGFLERHGVRWSCVLLMSVARFGAPTLELAKGA